MTWFESPFSRLVCDRMGSQHSPRAHRAPGRGRAGAVDAAADAVVVSVRGQGAPVDRHRAEVVDPPTIGGGVAGQSAAANGQRADVVYAAAVTVGGGVAGQGTAAADCRHAAVPEA